MSFLGLFGGNSTTEVTYDTTTTTTKADGTMEVVNVVGTDVYSKNKDNGKVNLSSIAMGTGVALGIEGLIYLGCKANKKHKEKKAEQDAAQAVLAAYKNGSLEKEILEKAAANNRSMADKAKVPEVCAADKAEMVSISKAEYEVFRKMMEEYQKGASEN